MQRLVDNEGLAVPFNLRPFLNRNRNRRAGDGDHPKTLFEHAMQNEFTNDSAVRGRTDV
jgi:hypothetical protein